ncbi:MAG: helix-turn-helix domain-containing protein [Hyphomicrobiaceae bacterium]|nr:helix-turn-helix domain-containing protein [Hyphomicrobiaceae bacterium]
MPRKSSNTGETGEVAASHAIGTVARRTGIKVPTIRYYESIGLLREPVRTEAGRRVYDDAAVSRLKFIRHARELGFEIEQIRRLLELAGEPQGSCAEIDKIAKAHLADIDSRIARLKALRVEMQHMISECAHGKVCECRILEVLSNHSYCQHDKH